MEVAESINQGLSVPLVYNCGGYDLVSTLELLDGIFDIYMPDFKLWSSNTSKTLLNAEDYPVLAKDALSEMHRQVGDLGIGKYGVARKGLLVRHLVMPGMLADTAEILNFIALEISQDTYLNIMDQYHPCGKTGDFPGINRPLEREEYEEALLLAKDAGMTRLDQRDWSSLIKRLM